MTPKYVTDNNKAAKLFREDFYATADMLAMGITRLIQDKTKAEDITVKMIKRKMHDMFYAHGMGAFTDSPSTEARKICKDMFPEFFEEMVVLEDGGPAKTKSTPKAPEPAKGSTKSLVKHPEPKKDTKAPAAGTKKATAPDFAAAQA